jgi:NADPH:quinone reductase-like Zn-dependent oxidoreductase
MAKNAGAYVAATCSGRTLSFVNENLSVDYLVNYNEQDWAQDETLKGYDVVFDTVGEKDGLSRATSNGTVKADGKFISIADFSIGLDPNAYPPLTFGAAICFLQNTHTQDEIAQWIEQGKLKIFFDGEYDLTTEGARGLYSKIAGGKSIGKNILNVSA